MEKIKTITVKAEINAPVDKVWKFYTTSEHIKKWNNASDDWHTPNAVNDLKVSGKFNYRMESVDGKIGFNFKGIYTMVKTNELISYTIEDGRKVNVILITNKSGSKETTNVSVTFEAENENSLDKQKAGWQAILNNFKHYVETTN